MRLGSNVRAPRFTVEAPDSSLAARYVQSAELNGKPLTASWFTASSVRPGGVLRLDMGVLPDRSYGAAPENRPPSSAATVDDLTTFDCVG